MKGKEWIKESLLIIGNLFILFYVTTYGFLFSIGSLLTTGIDLILLCIVLATLIVDIVAILNIVNIVLWSD
jgi:hypothetical protein